MEIINMCDDGHEKVIYFTYNCPLCAMKDEDYHYLEKENENLKDDISDLRNNVQRLEKQLRG